MDHSQLWEPSFVQVAVRKPFIWSTKPCRLWLIQQHGRNMTRVWPMTRLLQWLIQGLSKVSQSPRRRLGEGIEGMLFRHSIETKQMHTHSRQPQDRLEGLKRLRVVKEAHPNSRNPSKGSFYWKSIGFSKDCHERFGRIWSKKSSHRSNAWFWRSGRLTPSQREMGHLKLAQCFVKLSHPLNSKRGLPKVPMLWLFTVVRLHLWMTPMPASRPDAHHLELRIHEMHQEQVTAQGPRSHQEFMWMCQEESFTWTRW